MIPDKGGELRSAACLSEWPASLKTLLKGWYGCATRAKTVVGGEDMIGGERRRDLLLFARVRGEVRIAGSDSVVERGGSWLA